MPPYFKKLIPLSHKIKGLPELFAEAAAVQGVEKYWTISLLRNGHPALRNTSFLFIPIFRLTLREAHAL